MITHPFPLFQQMCALLGGRMAEAIALKTISTGAHDDLQRVTSIDQQIVTSFGMSQKVCVCVCLCVSTLVCVCLCVSMLVCVCESVSECV